MDQPSSRPTLQPSCRTSQFDNAKGRSDVFLGKTVSAVAEVSQSLGLAWNGVCWCSDVDLNEASENATGASISGGCAVLPRTC
jgi:hypothetical protein